MSRQIGVLCATAAQLVMANVIGIEKTSHLAWLPSGCSGSVQVAQELAEMKGKPSTVVIFTHFDCINDDAQHIRLGDIIIQSHKEPSESIKAAILLALSTTDVGAKSTAIAKSIPKPERFQYPKDAQDVRQTAGSPAVHWIPLDDTKLVADRNESLGADGGRSLFDRCGLQGPILVGGVVDYKCATIPPYDDVFKFYAATNAAVILGPLVQSLGAPADKPVKWPPAATAASASVTESKGDVKQAIEERKKSVEEAAVKRQLEVKTATEKHQLDKRRADHEAAKSNCKRKIVEIGADLEQAIAKVRKLEGDLVSSRELLLKLESEQIV